MPARNATMFLGSLILAGFMAIFILFMHNAQNTSSWATNCAKSGGHLGVTSPSHYTCIH